MTIETKRNNIEPMFTSIAFVVVVLLRLLRTIVALEGIGLRQPASSEPVAHGRTGLNTIWISRFSVPDGFQVGSFSLFCETISNPGSLMAVFALIYKSILHFGMFIKFQSWFNILASTASFRFNWFRHGRLLLISDYCLEPVASYTLAVGSLYCSRFMGGVK